MLHNLFAEFVSSYSQLTLSLYLFFLFSVTFWYLLFHLCVQDNMLWRENVCQPLRTQQSLHFWWVCTLKLCILQMRLQLIHTVLIVSCTQTEPIFKNRDPGGWVGHTSALGTYPLFGGREDWRMKQGKSLCGQCKMWMDFSRTSTLAQVKLYFWYIILCYGF